MNILTKLTIIVILSLSCQVDQSKSLNQRWTKEKANAWYDAQKWINGFNYVPSYVGNTTEWWENPLDTSIIERELCWAQDLGYTSARVFLQYIVWKKDPESFKKNFSLFLKLAASKNISVMPVLFDDCAFGVPPQLDPYLGKQREIIPGMILSNWTPSPGQTLGTDANEIPHLKNYVEDILDTYGDDERIIMWDLFNEPMNASKVGTPAFITRLFEWAREINPIQPLSIAIWSEEVDETLNKVILEHSDVVSFHLYSDHVHMSKKIASLKKYERPIICTEWMARPAGSNFKTDLPLFKSEHVAAYQWGLVNGKTQCQYPWWNKPGGEVHSAGWFHDILYPDGTPYRQEEIDFIKSFTAFE